MDLELFNWIFIYINNYLNPDPDYHVIVINGTI